MSDAPPILVLTSCTATKTLGGPSGSIRAEALYAGQQHLRLMRGVRAYRRARHPAGSLRLRIVSARHGLLAARTPITVYDESFNGLGRIEIRDRAHELGLPNAVRTLLCQKWGLVLILLGDDYLAAIDLDKDLKLGGPAVALCGPRVAMGMPFHPKLSLVAVGAAEAKRFSCGLIALKGELAGRTLRALAQRPQDLKQLRRPGFSWLDWLEALPATHGATALKGDRPAVARQEGA